MNLTELTAMADKANTNLELAQEAHARATTLYRRAADHLRKCENMLAKATTQLDEITDLQIAELNAQAKAQAKERNQ